MMNKNTEVPTGAQSRK